MKHPSNTLSFHPLPVTRDLTRDYVLSLIVALSVIAASLGGLMFPAALYPADALRQAFLPNDLINLLFGVPILLASMWLARRGRLVGLLCWPGALLYTFYNYIAYIIGMPGSLVTLAYIVPVLLSAYLVFVLVRSIDWEAVKKQLAGAVPEKLSGGVLFTFGVAFSVLAVGVISSAGTNHSSVQKTDLGVAIADVALSVILCVGGVLLFQRKPLGYASGLGLLFTASALFIGIILIVLIKPVLTDAPFVMEDLIILAGMGLVCFIPFLLFLRGVASKGV
jgi:uncharacterized membrane protein YidH (DUF202 family)